MTNLSDPDYLSKIDLLWTEQLHLANIGWNGYGLLLDKGKVVVTAFLDLGADPDPLIALFTENQLATPRIIHIERFRQMSTGTTSAGIGLFQPGGLLYTTYSGPNCAEGCHGTLGALVTDDTGPIWMLSNQHILAGRPKCINSVEVRGPGGTRISRTVVPCSSNMVDAAIASVPDGQKVFPIYNGINITCHVPIWPTINSEVQKLGNATRVTSGIFVGCCIKVLVSPCDPNGSSSEFANQLVISSKPSAPFLAKGDSGSLVVGNGHPVGLLFAISNQLGSDPFPGTIPFGLANPFGYVLANLQPLSPKWHMLLDPSQDTCKTDHSKSAPTDCKSALLSAEFAATPAKQ